MARANAEDRPSTRGGEPPNAAWEHLFQLIFSWVPAVNPSNSPKGGQAMPTGQERTKEQLYSQAKRLGFKGCSKVNKGQLKAALARRGH